MSQGLHRENWGPEGLSELPGSDYISEVKLNSDLWDPVIQLNHKSTFPLFNHQIKSEIEEKLNFNLFGIIFASIFGPDFKSIIFFL